MRDDTKTQEILDEVLEEILSETDADPNDADILAIDPEPHAAVMIYPPRRPPPLPRDARSRDERSRSEASAVSAGPTTNPHEPQTEPSLPGAGQYRHRFKERSENAVAAASVRYLLKSYELLRGLHQDGSLLPEEQETFRSIEAFLLRNRLIR